MKKIIFRTSAGEVQSEVDERAEVIYVDLSDSDINTLVGIADTGGGSGDGGGGAASADDFTLKMTFADDLSWNDDGNTHEIDISKLGITEEQFQKATNGDYIRATASSHCCFICGFANEEEAISNNDLGPYFDLWMLEGGELLSIIYDMTEEKYKYMISYPNE